VAGKRALTVVRIRNEMAVQYQTAIIFVTHEEAGEGRAI